MGGGKGGGGGGGNFAMPTPAPSPYEEQLAAIAKDAWSSTIPLRKTYISDWENFLSPQKVLRPGAVPIRTPQYSTVTTPSWSPTFIGSNDAVYGADKISTLGTGPDISYYVTPTGNAQDYWSVKPFGYEQIPGGGGTTQNLTGYKEEYRPEDYITERFNPANLPGYTPAYDIARRGLEAQYGTAKDQITTNTPRGGALSDALAKLELGRAESVGGLPAQISSNLIQDMLNKSYGAAFNAPSQAISGLSAANQGYTSTQNAMLNAAMQQQALNQQASNSKGSGLGLLGTGLGMTVGSMLGSPNMPWIFK